MALKAITKAYHNASRAIISRGRSIEWRRISDDFQNRHPQCAGCGGVERLQVHHIVPFHLCPELELDETNLIVLCMWGDNDCHLRLGHGGNFKAWNPFLHDHVERLQEDPAMRSWIVREALRVRRFDV